MNYDSIEIQGISLSDAAEAVSQDNTELGDLISENMPHSACKLAFIFGALWQQSQTAIINHSERNAMISLIQQMGYIIQKLDTKSQFPNHWNNEGYVPELSDIFNTISTPEQEV